MIQGKDIDINHTTPSLTFLEGNQCEFNHYISECNQNVSSVIRWDISSVRNHFNDEMNDELIISFCKIVNIEHKINDFGIDSRINNRLSGGEKQRITLATNLYYNYINKTKILIIDEPEKGLGNFYYIMFL